MKAEHGAHAGHGALVDQLGRTAWERLLGGLEDEPDVAIELLHLRQHLGDPKGDRGVDIVSTCVHHTWDARGEGQAGPLLDGESVQIGPKCHHWAGGAHLGDQPVLPDRRRTPTPAEPSASATRSVVWNSWLPSSG